MDLQDRQSWQHRLTSADQWWPHLVLCILTVLLFDQLKTQLVQGNSLDISPVWRLLILCAIAALFFRLKMADLPKPTRLTLRGIGLLLAAYLCLAYPPLPAEPGVEEALTSVTLFRWAGVALFSIGWWLPAWMIPALTAFTFEKTALSRLAGISISPTDYTPVIEFGYVLALGACLFHLGQHLGLWRKADQDNRLGPQEAVYLTAVAVHFANYFYSGLQKVRISDPWWQWAVENPTQYLTLAAWERGNLPITLLGDTIAWALYTAFAFGVVAVNFMTLGGQLAAIAAFARIGWIVLLTAFFDLMHLTIFLLSGIFFYKWIWLNLLIVISLSLIVRKRLALSLRIWLIAVVIYAPDYFFVARLGWFDTPSFNDEYLEATTTDGRILRVPDTYFLATSVPHAQQRLVPEKPGFFLTGSYGNLYLGALPQLSFNDAQECRIGAPDPAGLDAAIARRGLDKYIATHHRLVESRLDRQGRLNYDFYPHHIFSMPWEYADFRRLDKREIAGYRYVLEAKCLRFEGGRPHAETLARGEHYVPVVR